MVICGANLKNNGDVSTRRAGRVASALLGFSLAMITPLAAAPVDDARLRNAEADHANWMTYGRDYGNHRFSPLTQINRDTIQQLAPRWIYQTGVAASFQATPIVVDGVLYLSTPFAPTAFDPSTGLAFVAATHMPIRYTKHNLPATSDKPAAPYATLEPENGPVWGTLSAISTQDKGRIRWQHKTQHPLVGGVLATAGGLVFTGEGNGYLDAFDAETGKLLWQFQCGAGVNAPPISFEVDGVQYIAVAAGGNAIFGFKQGDALIVFALPKRAS